MSIFLNKDSKVIVQGITGGEGTKHTRLMLRAGTNVVGRRQRPQGRHHGDPPGRRRQRRRPARLRLGRRGDQGDRRRRVGRLRAAGVHQGRRDRGHRRRDRAAGDHHRGRAGAGQRRVLGLRPGQEHPHHRAELPRHHHARRGAGRHHARHHRRQGPGRTGVEVGHADLPDDVRAQGLRLLDRHRHRRRPDHRDDPHRRPRGVRGGPRDQGDRDDRRDRRRRRRRRQRRTSRST